MVIVDTSFLVAFLDAGESDHAAVAAAIAAADGPFVVSPYVVAEADYLVLSRHGVAAEVELLRQLGGGQWELATLTPMDFANATDVVDRWRDERIGITDASLVVLSDRLRTKTIATLDRRHFGVLRAGDGRPFDLIP
jgi:predicted nucleic acid-binding protein